MPSRESAGLRLIFALIEANSWPILTKSEWKSGQIQRVRSRQSFLNGLLRRIASLLYQGDYIAALEGAMRLTGKVYSLLIAVNRNHDALRQCIGL